MPPQKKLTRDEALVKVQRYLKKMPNHRDSLEVKPIEDQDVIFLLNPWGDRSVALIAYKDGVVNKTLFDVLEKVQFPPDLSALFHTEQRILEIIWTSYKLSPESEEIRGREFEFCLSGKTYKCHFSKSTQDLIELSACAAYLQISETGFRNLQSFSAYANGKPTSGKPPRLGDPVSFFIEGMPENKEDWPELIKHLNFYLKYYDNKSPHIIIHETEQQKNNDKIRYIEDSFPKKIVSRELNQNLLSLWLAAYDHDITTKFLLYYRILEYVSSLYLQAKQRQALLRVLNSPSALSSLDGTLDSVAAIVREDSSAEIDRYVKIFEELVDKVRFGARFAVTKLRSLPTPSSTGALKSKLSSQTCNLSTPLDRRECNR